MDQRLVYDVGLHEREDSEFFLKKGFRVVAVEADPTLCEYSRSRLRTHIDSGELTVINAAIAEKDGPIQFLANERDSVWGTTSEEWARRNERLGAASKRITVDGIRFERILREFGIPYYLKIDIEGADLLCVKGLFEFESRPKHISIESTKTSWGELRREFDLFKALGYSKFKVVPQKHMSDQRCPFPAKEGRHADHRFERGASGPFGEEARGRWLSEAEALAAYRRVFLGYKIYGDDGILRRVCRSLIGNRLARHLPAADWYDTHASR